jgi:FtsP/CotA-like multicopper oxidase with cupredoxin domain
MEHVLHFHGFHAEILHASDPTRIGWVKDTFPLDVSSTLTLKLVVDLEGTYPVHDHNLIAVTNTGFYPGGMITHIVVSP